MMRGGLADDGSERRFRGGGRGGGSCRRARSWERRSDPDDRVGEIDDQSEGSSYGIGERMVVSRREDGGRRIVRFERA